MLADAALALKMLNIFAFWYGSGPGHIFSSQGCKSDGCDCGCGWFEKWVGKQLSGGQRRRLNTHTQIQSNTHMQRLESKANTATSQVLLEYIYIYLYIYIFVKLVAKRTLHSNQPWLWAYVLEYCEPWKIEKLSRRPRLHAAYVHICRQKNIYISFGGLFLARPKWSTQIWKFLAKTNTAYGLSNLLAI